MLKIGDQEVHSRFLLGTARYPSPEILKQAIEAAQTEIITVSIRRQSPGLKNNPFWELIKSLDCHILPNTAGCFSAKEAVFTAKMARELFNTNWIKVEVMGDDHTLQPHPMELIKATEELIKDGFEVFPYCTDDLICCQELVNVGCRILMPLASHIGSGKGILNPYSLKLLRERFPDKTIIIDAGIGKPSHAVEAMEMGMDAVLLNTAVARSAHPIQMAEAFSKAIFAGRLAYEAGMMVSQDMAHMSTPMIGKPFWQENKG
jgi:thiazole synthase